MYKLKDIERYCKTKILAKPVPSLDDVKNTKLDNMFDKIRQTIEEGGLTDMVNLVEEHVNQEEYTSMDMAAALLKCEVPLVTGKGAGLSEKGLLHKQEVIGQAIRKYDLYEKEAFTILETVGGLDIAGLVGVCIGGAIYRIPIVLDGVISLVAALTAEKIAPGTKEYLLTSHQGKEPAAKFLLKSLEKEAVLNAHMALGEGTGAVMMFPLLDMALRVYHAETTFFDIQVEQYQRFDKL